MIRVALRGLAGRKLRATLTAFAIILGVAMVSGTYVLTDTIDKAFDNIFSETSRTADVVSGEDRLDLRRRLGGHAAGRPKCAPADQGSSGCGSRRREPSSTTRTDHPKKDGDRERRGPVLRLLDRPASPQFNPLKLVEGKWPTGPNEVVIDAAPRTSRATRSGTRSRSPPAGSLVRPRRARAVRRRSRDRLGAPSPSSRFRRHRPCSTAWGRYDTISVDGKEGVTQQALADEIKPILPPTAQVRTADARHRRRARTSRSRSSSATSCSHSQVWRFSSGRS